MATVKVIFRSSSRDNGEGYLYYRIIHRRMVRQVHTGLRIKLDEWDGNSGRPILRGDDSRTRYLRSVQSVLDEGLAKIKVIIDCLALSGEEFTAATILHKFMGADRESDFIAFARRHIIDLKRMEKFRAAEHYTAAVNSFVRFTGDVRVPFDELSIGLIGRYEQYLIARGLCPNTTSYYMRNLRAIYNQAVDQNLTEQRSPFRHVYTGVAKTTKRAVSIDTIRALRDMNLSSNPTAELARDVFLFSFYTRGMSVIDVAFLKNSDLRHGVLTYRRHKTGQQLTIRWEPQMQEIATRYATNDSGFIFPILHTPNDGYYRQYRLVYNKLLRHLEKLGQELDLAEPLTFHRSRHSWASIARDNNIPLSVICEAMGHNSEKTTRIYLASLDTSIVDKANCAIIRLLDTPAI